MFRKDRMKWFIIYLHCYWLLEFSTLLDLEHEVSTIDIFHNEVESVLQQNRRY